VLDLGSVPQGLSFKSTPEKFAELTEHEGISPAPYVGRYKWVMLDRLDAVSDAELEDLIQQSYAMVAAKAPKRLKSRARPTTKKKTKSARTSKKSGFPKRKLRRN